LISLAKIKPRFSRIAIGPDGDLRIGAMTSLSTVEHDASVRRHAPVIVRAMQRLSNVRVRNVATIGGNLAHADPHMDLPPVLIALGGSVVIAGRSGERTIPLEKLFVGYYETVVLRDELITEVRIPPQHSRNTVYLKCTTGSADDWPALGVAASIEADRSGIRSAALVVGAATEKPIRLKAAEGILSGTQATDAVLRRAGDTAADEVDLIGDARGSAAYKRELLRVYVVRAASLALATNGGRG
ncbi:MAG: FAD binding domain-containing protein, partial [Bradyrhizobiaceae bacterium]|nr:FAD binding domain-containing protein [Bradyrhizobiaceae bacterium]